MDTHTPLAASKAFLVPSNSQHPWTVYLSLGECTWWNETLPQKLPGGCTGGVSTTLCFFTSLTKAKMSSKTGQNWFSSRTREFWLLERCFVSLGLLETMDPVDSYFVPRTCHCPWHPATLHFLFLWDYPRQVLLWETEYCWELPLMQQLSFITGCKVESTLWF